jgi:putative hydrolase
MEINMKHPKLDAAGIRTAMKEDVRFVISSDAHVVRNVGIFEGGLSRALEAGLDPARIVNIRRKDR